MTETDDFHEDTEKCQCLRWTYAHHKSEVWMMVDGDLTYPTLGHHPGCMYYIKPPHESLTGLGYTHDRQALSVALVELAKAYSKLYWSVNPPKPPTYGDDE